MYTIIISIKSTLVGLVNIKIINNSLTSNNILKSEPAL